MMGKMKSAIAGLLKRRPFRAFRKAPSAHEYWEQRVRKFGRQSVLNLNHSQDEFETVTQYQKKEIYPHFRRALRGDEKVVLDYGCGPGRFSPDLAEMIGSCVGVDIVAGLLDLAPKSSLVQYKVMRDGVIPLPSDSADAVWVCLVLGGIDGEDLVRSVSEIKRVLLPGGLLFVVENTSDQRDGEYWRFRTVQQYLELFPYAALHHVHDYDDLGERISVMSGRKVEGE
jgi:ubiquinone/menaquinone biosynthesis C-methylase UbiE